MAASLRHARVFRGLSEESLELLASVAQRRSYRRGELILPEQHDDDTVFVVVSGGVRLYLLGPGGQELTLFRRRTGDMFELGTVAPEWPDETVAEALAHGTVVYAIPWQRFFEVLSARRETVASLAELLRFRRAEEQGLLRELAFYSMKARLAHKLAELAREAGRCVVTETHEALAAMVGTRPEEVTKALHQLRTEGLVDFPPRRRRQIVVLDVHRLAAYGKDR